MTIQQIEDAEYHYDDFCTYPDESIKLPKQRWKIRVDGDTTRKWNLPLTYVTKEAF